MCLRAGMHWFHFTVTMIQIREIGAAELLPTVLWIPRLSSGAFWSTLCVTSAVYKPTSEIDSV